jgi:glycosyltransferase 2 family protein
MRISLKSILQAAFFLLLGIGLVWWSWRSMRNEWPAISQSLRNAKWWLFVPVIFILSGSHVVRALRWQLLIHPLGYRPKFSNAFFAVMVGYLANMALPRLGEVLKCTILGKYEKVPAEKLVGTILVERAFDVVCLLFIFLITFLWNSAIIGQLLLDNLKKLFLNAEGQVSWTKLSLMFSVVLALGLLARWLLRQSANSGWMQKAKGIVNGVMDGLLSFKKMERKKTFLFYSAFIWVLYVVGTWVGFKAMEETSMLGFKEAFPALAFGSIGMLATPGGIGAYAAFFQLVLPKFGVAPIYAALNGHLQWFGQFVVVLVVGFASVQLLPRFNKNYQPKFLPNETD